MLGAYAGDAMRNGRGGLFLAGWETACIHENSCDFILDHMGASDTMLVIDNSGDLEKTQRSHQEPAPSSKVRSASLVSAATSPQRHQPQLLGASSR
jgi:hypothetical protein